VSHGLPIVAQLPENYHLQILTALSPASTSLL
jgi:hypothetical protein